jgi:hypothetical protein
MKNIIHVHFFEKILKQGVDVDRIWSFNDEKRLVSGINELIRPVQKNSHDVETTCLLQVDKSMKVTVIDADVSKNPAIQKFAVLFINTSIKALLRDIVSLNEKTTENLLTFHMFNRKLCSLINPISSCSYHSFKHNVIRTKWMDDLLSAVNNNIALAAEWILTILDKRFEEILTEVEVLLSKNMDAESACTMWEEANCMYKSQRVILRHLKCFFGRRITVPETYIRELENGAPPHPPYIK